MMWYCYAFLSFGCCMALRTRELPALVKKNTLELVLTLSNPEAGTGTPIEIAVDGVRQVSKIHPTERGKPVVFHHIAKGSVVTAHVGSQGACAFWVTPRVEHCTAGEWEVSLTTVEENEDAIVSDTMYEAFVQVVGWGSEVTIDVDGVQIKAFDAVAQHETFRQAGLRRGNAVRAVSTETGDTCLYRVGDADTVCHLDGTWGVLLGSIKKFDEDHADEGAVSTETQKYTVEFALQRDDAAAKKLDIGLNGHLIASKLYPTEVGKSIIVHHVKTGSVFTAVAHDNETACCIYVGENTGLQTVACAGWTMNLNIQKENDKSFEHHEMLFDVGFLVHRVSADTTGTWGLEVNGETEVSSVFPRLFPGHVGGLVRGTKVISMVDQVASEDCAHVVGGDETTCEYMGWNFTIWSKLNMNAEWNGDNWDWDDTDIDINIDIDDPESFEVRVMATDNSDSTEQVTLECIARQDLEFYTVPDGETERHIRKGANLFKTKTLKKNTPESVMKSAEFVGHFRTGYSLKNGFVCTIYKEESIMCEANSDGGLWTNDKKFNLEIHIAN